MSIVELVNGQIFWKDRAGFTYAAEGHAKEKLKLRSDNVSVRHREAEVRRQQCLKLRLSKKRPVKAKTGVSKVR